MNARLDPDGCAATARRISPESLASILNPLIQSGYPQGPVIVDGWGRFGAKPGKEPSLTQVKDGSSAMEPNTGRGQSARERPLVW